MLHDLCGHSKGEQFILAVPVGIMNATLCISLFHRKYFCLM